MADHLNILCKPCIYQLRKIQSILRNLPVIATMTIKYSFTFMCLDYCNSILQELIQLQLQCRPKYYFAIRAVANKPKYLHISQLILEKLHRLPVAEQICFKIICWHVLQSLALSMNAIGNSLFKIFQVNMVGDSRTLLAVEISRPTGKPMHLVVKVLSEIEGENRNQLKRHG